MPNTSVKKNIYRNKNANEFTINNTWTLFSKKIDKNRVKLTMYKPQLGELKNATLKKLISANDIAM